jgi:NAD(P)-dependent dehydrogenase (short-subunit alcohol dehydrogenase family)
MSAAGTGRLAGRIALITGASRGIGRAVALRFAAEAADVVLVARTQGALEDLDDEIRRLGGHAALVVGDLAEPELVERIGVAVGERWGRLDVLVGNAASLGRLSPVGHIDPGAWERVITLNLTANYRLIRAFDPLLRLAPNGRALFVTDRIAEGRAYWGAYAVSKGALESLIRTYAQEVAKTSLRVNLIDPGPTRTRLRAEAFPGEDPATLKPADDATLMEAFVALADDGCLRHGDRVAL